MTSSFQVLPTSRFDMEWEIVQVELVVITSIDAADSFAAWLQDTRNALSDNPKLMIGDYNGGETTQPVIDGTSIRFVWPQPSRSTGGSTKRVDFMPQRKLLLRNRPDGSIVVLTVQTISTATVGTRSLKWKLYFLGRQLVRP